VTFRATAVLPFNNLAQATAGLRGRLRLMIADYSAEVSPDWDTLVVTGPTTTKDARGNTWFEWAATVETKPLSLSGYDDSAERPPVVDDQMEPGASAADGSTAGPVPGRPTVNDRGLLRRFGA
jgi:hypothetical protein